MSEQFQPADPARFAAALQRFDRENRRDPNIVMLEGAPQPRELVYARWLSEWVLRRSARRLPKRLGSRLVASTFVAGSLLAMLIP